MFSTTTQSTLVASVITDVTGFLTSNLVEVIAFAVGVTLAFWLVRKLFRIGKGGRF